jgi:2-amino-4-hydroxy-6-hydroxymethyldihydropteridine diphosphokinase
VSGVYIGLGSNLGDGSALIRSAVALLGSGPGIRILRVSSLYRSAPWGLRDQPDFTNAVAELTTELEPEDLLRALLECERRLGRVRSAERWGPRSIDIDLLAYGDRQTHTPSLELPHPRMAERAFVLIPLLELAPDYAIPGIGPANACLERLAGQKVERIG